MALQVAERLRSAMAEAPLLKAPLLPVTVSIGAAQLSAGQTASALLEAADQAVYVAKRGGRNQVQPNPGGTVAGVSPRVDAKTTFGAPAKRR